MHISVDGDGKVNRQNSFKKNQTNTSIKGKYRKDYSKFVDKKMTNQKKIGLEQQKEMEDRVGQAKVFEYAKLPGRIQNQPSDSVEQIADNV